MTKIILHVGAHKTGTTYIQKVFDNNHKKLAEKGILYPKRWLGNLWGHHELVFKIRRNETENLTKVFEELKEKYNTIIISSENFEDFNKNQFLTLKNILGEDVELQVVFFIRRLPKILPSQWQEHIKHGSFQTLPSFLLENVAFPFNSNLLNYNLRLDRIASVFGKESLKIVAYDNLIDQNIDIATYFSNQFIGQDLDLSIENKKVNVSLTPELIEIIRLLNLKLYTKTSVKSLHARYYLLSLLEKGILNIDDLLEMMKEYKISEILDDQSFIFRKLYEHVQHNYRSNILNAAAAGKLFMNTGATKQKYISSDFVINEKFNDAFLNVYTIIEENLENIIKQRQK